MKKKYLIGFIIFVFIILQVWCSYIVFQVPYIGIDLEYTQSQWVINDLSNEGANSKLNFKLGDVVKEVNGKQPEAAASVHRWQGIEQADTILISRDGHDYLITITDKMNSSNSYDMVPLVEEFICLFMVVLLFSKMHRSISARLLGLVFLSATFIFMSLGASVRGDIIAKVMITSFMMLMPIVFLHFLIVFFKEKGDFELPTGLLKYSYVLVLLAFLLRMLYFVPSMTFKVYKYDIKVTLIFFIIGFILNVYALTILYFKVRRQQNYISSIVRSVWISWLISFLPIICFSFLPLVATGQQIINARYTSWFLFFFPLSFVYLIASNQLYNIGYIIRRFLFAGLIAILPVSLFTGAYVFLFKIETNEKQILFNFIGSMLLVTLVLYAAEYWTTRLEPFLFPRKYVLQSALKNIARNLGAISSFRELKEIILVDIVNTLQVMGGAIVFNYKDDTEIIYEGDVDISEIRRLIESSTLLEHPMYTCIEMNYHEAYTSYLVMTHKKTNMLLAKEEKQWLQLITSYLEVSLENVHLIRKLTVNLQQFASQLPHEAAAYDIQWFRKVMFELQEEERVRIATDLHDTTMQDLFFLKRRLSTMADNPSMSKGDQEQLRNMNKFVDLINASLRQSCFELNPHLLKEVGLIKTLKMYVEKESYTTEFELEFDARSVVLVEDKDLPTKRHIFRIVQELLNNAKKHSQASKVTFRIVETSQFFCLNYEDNGVGFNVHETPQLKIGSSGVGIEQLRSRVIHMGGQLEFLSQTGSGTTFKMRIPIEEVIST